MLVFLRPVGLEAEKGADKDGLKSAVRSNNDFALDLYACMKDDEGNLFYSPASISTALAMTYSGARGQTADEMRKTLRFYLEDSELHPSFGQLSKSLEKKIKGCTLTTANALWGQKGGKLLQKFMAITKKHYGAGLTELDFVGSTEKAIKTINKWVKKKTNKKIKELVSKQTVNKGTRLVLTNAIYFKGKWNIQFSKQDTKKETFHVTGSSTVDVDMMHLKSKRFKYFKGEGFAAVAMPYKGGDVAMIIFLPDEIDGLAGLEKSLTSENMDTWLQGMTERKISDLALPRFKMTRELMLADTLKQMGMVSAFSGNADFSGMNGKKNLFISAVVHKAFIEVNEEGTEAAAATGVVMGEKSMVKQLNFRVDHPFAFIIRDIQTGAVLFAGRITNPTG